MKTYCNCSVCTESSCKLFCNVFIKITCFHSKPPFPLQKIKNYAYYIAFPVFLNNICLDYFVLFFPVVNSVNMQNLVTLAAMGANSVSPTGKRE